MGISAICPYLGHALVLLPRSARKVLTRQDRWVKKSNTSMLACIVPNFCTPHSRSECQRRPSVKILQSCKSCKPPPSVYFDSLRSLLWSCLRQSTSPWSVVVNPPPARQRDCKLPTENSADYVPLLLLGIFHAKCMDLSSFLHYFFQKKIDDPPHSGIYFFKNLLH